MTFRTYYHKPKAETMAIEEIVEKLLTDLEKKESLEIDDTNILRGLLEFVNTIQRRAERLLADKPRGY